MARKNSFTPRVITDGSLIAANIVPDAKRHLKRLRAEKERRGLNYLTRTTVHAFGPSMVMTCSATGDEVRIISSGLVGLTLCEIRETYAFKTRINGFAGFSAFEPSYTFNTGTGEMFEGAKAEVTITDTNPYRDDLGYDWENEFRSNGGALELYATGEIDFKTIYKRLYNAGQDDLLGRFIYAGIRNLEVNYSKNLNYPYTKYLETLMFSKLLENGDILFVVSTGTQLYSQYVGYEDLLKNIYSFTFSELVSALKGKTQLYLSPPGTFPIPLAATQHNVEADMLPTISVNGRDDFIRGENQEGHVWIGPFDQSDITINAMAYRPIQGFRITYRYTRPIIEQFDEGIPDHTIDLITSGFDVANATKADIKAGVLFSEQVPYVNKISNLQAQFETDPGEVEQYTITYEQLPPTDDIADHWRQTTITTEVDLKFTGYLNGALGIREEYIYNSGTSYIGTASNPPNEGSHTWEVVAFFPGSYEHENYSGDAVYTIEIPSLGLFYETGFFRSDGLTSYERIYTQTVIGGAKTLLGEITLEENTNPLLDVFKVSESTFTQTWPFVPRTYEPPPGSIPKGSSYTGTVNTYPTAPPLQSIRTDINSQDWMLADITSKFPVPIGLHLTVLVPPKTPTGVPGFALFEFSSVLGQQVIPVDFYEDVDAYEAAKKVGTAGQLAATKAKVESYVTVVVNNCVENIAEVLLAWREAEVDKYSDDALYGNERSGLMVVYTV